MGNYMSCLKDKKHKKHGKKSESKAAEKKLRALEEELMQQQLLALAFHQQKKAQARLPRAASQRQSNLTNFAADKVPRSASVRGRALGDPLVDPHQLVNGLRDKGVPLNLDTKHFVLVHGGGYGAWCWYKSIALLEEAGFKATAIDLTGSGVDATDPNCIVSLSQYVKPLICFLEGLAEEEKIILVGHSFGGSCISYAMEYFPQKIAKAVFVTAAMVANDQRAFDIFAEEVVTSDNILRNAQSFIYGNGSSHPPTSIEFDRNLIKDVFFNQCPAKDVALASVSLRPVPFAPILEKLTLTMGKYGIVRRFFVETTEDKALTPALQERVIRNNPPERVFKVKGSDHSPFLSKPQSLHKIFVEIAKLDMGETCMTPRNT